MAVPRLRSRGYRGARRASCRIAGVFALCVSTSRVEANVAEDRATARELAIAGIEAARDGDCVTAIDLLRRAEALYHAPSHLQFLARCHAREGRLVEATELLRALLQERITPSSPEPFRVAVAEAEVELPKLLARLARLSVHVRGGRDDVVVTIDGHVLPAAAHGVRRVIDPGRHVVRATAPTSSVAPEVVVTLMDGESRDVELVIPADALQRREGRSLGPGPFVVAGAGVAMLLGGTIAAGVAAGRFSALDRDCPERSRCNLPDLLDRRSEIATFATIANVLWVSGAVVAASGVAWGVFVARRIDSKNSEVRLGLGHVVWTTSF